MAAWLRPCTAGVSRVVTLTLRDTGTAAPVTATVRPFTRPVRGEVAPPGSKSLTNRALAPRARRVCLAFPLQGRDGALVNDQTALAGRLGEDPALARGCGEAETCQCERIEGEAEELYPGGRAAFNETVGQRRESLSQLLAAVERARLTSVGRRATGFTLKRGPAMDYTAGGGDSDDA